MMEWAETAGLFNLAAPAEITGCYLPWLVIRHGCFRHHERWLRSIAVAPESSVRAGARARRVGAVAPKKLILPAVPAARDESPSCLS